MVKKDLVLRIDRRMIKCWNFPLRMCVEAAIFRSPIHQKRMAMMKTFRYALTVLSLLFVFALLANLELAP